MKIPAFLLAGIFLVGISVGHADTMSLKSPIGQNIPTMNQWSAGDHWGTAKRYEEEARLLRAEARGMELVETKILPFLEVGAIKEAGIPKIIDRRLKEADEMMNFAKWHEKEALRLFAAREATTPTIVPSKKAVTTGMPHSGTPTHDSSYLKFDWMEEEDLWGW